MAKIKLSSPWNIYVDEVTQMFKGDPEVHVIYDEEKNKLSLYVDNSTKAEALSRLLPLDKTWGNVTLSIAIIPANHTSTVGNLTTNEQLCRAAFSGNKALSFIKTITGIFVNNLTYVVFENKVVQFFNDDLSDIYGQCSTLYQNIAADIFEAPEGVFFCTDVPDEEFDYKCKPDWP